MNYLLRWLLISGGAAALARIGGGPFRRASDQRILAGATLVLGGSWILTVADAFLPVMAVPPLGLLSFLLANVVSIASAIAAGALSVLVLARRTGRVPVPAGGTRVGVGLPLLVIVAAVASFIGERALSIIAAVGH
ncbi:hypothetical protein [Pseudolysinimonas sp.]|uniref:hypothetical protein n=1 Tax=Pseudolysinimonas sp. TaxID=2680009 RepID=UPI003F7F0EAA